MLQKANVNVSSSANLTQLKELVVEKLTAHQLLNGYSANDGLDKNTLADWCSSLGQTAYGSKAELTNRIIAYYDGIKQVTVSHEDERALYYHYYTDLASRNWSVLHQQGVISKDL